MYLCKLDITLIWQVSVATFAILVFIEGECMPPDKSA